MSDRARQFLPFDGVKGFREAIKEREKIKVEKKDLSNDDLDYLNQVVLRLKKNMIVKVIYFSNDEYIELEGLVSNIDLVSKSLKIVKKKIAFSDLMSISIIKENI